MELTMQRNKGSYTTEPMCATKDLIYTVNLIVDTELNWGGKVTDNGDHLVIVTKVFGDTDTTIIRGNEEELAFMRNVIKAHEDSGSVGVIKHFFNLMGFVHKGNVRYSFEDTCTVYRMWLEDPTLPDLCALISFKEIKSRAPVTQTKIDEAIELKKKLNLPSGDGVNLLLATQLLNGG